MEALSNFICNIDKENEGNLKHPEVEQIANGVETFVGSLHDAIIKEAQIYIGDIYGAGSFFDDLKIGYPDEFDFNFTLSGFVHGKNFILLSPTELSGYQNIQSPASEEENSLFKLVKFLDDDLAQKWSDNEKTINIGTNDKPEYILSPVGVKNELVDIINKVLQEISLPPSISVIGIVDLSGPAISIDLKWNGEKFTDLTVNVDISLAIDIPADVSLVKPLELFPEQHPLYYAMEEYVNEGYGYAVVPFVGEEPTKCWRISTGYLESFIFQAFERESKVKCLVRFMKTVKESKLIDQPDGTYILNIANNSLTQDCDSRDKREDQVYNKLFNIDSYNIKQILFHILRHINGEQVKNLGVGYAFIEMIKFLYEAVKSKTLTNFFIPTSKVNIPEFLDCHVCFEVILSIVKYAFMVYDVVKEERKKVWEELRAIYEDIKLLYNDYDIDSEYD